VFKWNRLSSSGEGETMSIKPILFNGDMVNAIRNGKKTATRRPMKEQPPAGFEYFGICPNDLLPHDADNLWMNGYACWRPKHPYEVGDILWVRETWLPDPDRDGTWADVEFDGCGMPLDLIPQRFRSPEHCLYRASWNGSDLNWRPSIHMPRWAARLFLLVTSVQAQRVQDVSEGDIIHEGCPNEYLLGQNWFRPLWDSIYANMTVRVEVSDGVYETRNANLSWNDNPWVFAYKFQVTDKPEGWG